MAGAGASCCGRAVMLLRLEVQRRGWNAGNCWAARQPTARLSVAAAAGGSRLVGLARCYGTFAGKNEIWCKRWWNSSRKSLSTSTRTLTPCLNSILSKEQQNYKEARDARDAREPKDGKESKDTKTTKESKETKESKKHAKDKTSTVEPPEVVVEYVRGLPRITIPLPSNPTKCAFTLRPLTQTVGEFLDMIKLEDPAVIDVSVTSTTGIKMAVTNRIETMLLDNFNLVINGKVYPVTPPILLEVPKENIQQMKDFKLIANKIYESFNAREHHAELERELMLQLEEIRIELEPLEQRRLEVEQEASRGYRPFAPYIILLLMSIQIGVIARLTWWEYSWDIMEPVTYFVTYATTMGCYIYFVVTRQEYMLPDVFHRNYLITLHKKAKKLGFDIDHYNRLKDQEHDIETMLRVIRGPLHRPLQLIEQRRRERASSSSSPSSSRSPSSSPSPSPERESVEHKKQNKNKKHDDKAATAHA